MSFARSDNSKKTRKTKVSESIDECKAKLDQLNSMFASFEVDNSKLQEIMSQKMAKELEEMMKPISKAYTLEVLGNKSYTLHTPDVKICEMFGSLESIGSVKVTVEFN